MSEIHPSNSNIESFDNPSVFIRPHHWTQYHELRWALRRSLGYVDYTGSMFGIDISSLRYRGKDRDQHYFDDIFGYNNYKSKEVGEGYQSFFEHLFNLPDHSTVEFGLTRDGICTSCVVGRHCTAIEQNVSPEEKAGYEQSDLQEIIDSLQRVDAEEGRDFIYKTRVHTFYRYGESIYLSKAEPTPVGVLFTGIVVNTAVLRKSRLIPDREPGDFIPKSMR